MTRRGVHVTSAIAILVIAFFYQVTRPAFLNDHFDHLSKARQMLHGEYPVRDFFDPGRPLDGWLVGCRPRAVTRHPAGRSDADDGGDCRWRHAGVLAGAAVHGVDTVGLLGGSLHAGHRSSLIQLPENSRPHGRRLAHPCMWTRHRRRAPPAWARGAGLGFSSDTISVYLAVATLAALLLRRSRDTARNAAIVGTVAGLVAAPYLIYLQQINALGSVAAEGGEGFLSAVRVSWIPFVSPFEYPGWRRLNAEIWVYDLFLFTPLVAFGGWLTRRITRPLSYHVVTLAVLCAALTLFLIRGIIDSRLPTSRPRPSGPVAWMLAALFEGGRARIAHWRWILAAVAVAVATLTVVSVQELVEWQSARRMTRAIARLPYVDLGADRAPGFGAARGLGE